MNTIHKNGDYIVSYMDEHVFNGSLKKGEIISWCSRIYIKNNDLTVTITIGDYIIMEWIAGKDSLKFDNRNDQEHPYSKIDVLWVKTAIAHDVIINLLPNTSNINPFNQ